VNYIPYFLLKINALIGIFRLLSSIVFSVSFSIVYSQDTLTKLTLDWKEIAKGVSYDEISAPIPSLVNDSKLFIVRIDPKDVVFELYSAKELNIPSMSASQWADSFGLNLVFNAGMYDLSNPLLSKAFFKRKNFYLNKTHHPNYNGVIALHPKDSLTIQPTIKDLKCESLQSIETNFDSYFQCMRMLDCTGDALSWGKKKQACSMMVLSMDKKGNLYLVFSRSPYTHNQFISFLKSLELPLVNTVYLEGGPETSLYIHSERATFQKIGSYISDTYENDDNDHFWNLPNVIGIRFK
jgi:hypothetical protein